MEVRSIMDTLKLIDEQSSTLITWSLALIGGSILTIISTSYHKPESTKAKLFYFLFFPAWFFLFYSVYCGNQISRRVIAASYANNDSVLDAINATINNNYKHQMNYFQIGLAFLALWLLAYFIWWLFATTKSD